MWKMITAMVFVLTSTLTSVGAASAAKIEDKTEKVMVVFNHKVDEKVIEDLGGELVETYQYFPGVLAIIPTNSESALRSHMDVKSVQVDLPLTEISAVRTVDTKLNYGASLIKATSSWEMGLTGSGVNVAVIDTGVDTGHPHLKIKAALNCITVCTLNNAKDRNGHGTHVAGIIAAQSNNFTGQGVAPNVNLYSLKVMDSGEGEEAYAYTSDIIRAIEWSIQNNMDIINLSLGSTRPDPAFEAVLRSAYQKGILIVAASGNKKPGTKDVPNYPAAYKASVISVGAIDDQLKRADFSVGGDTLEVVAPGVNVLSTYVTGNPPYAYLDGTSMATPYVVGTLALYKEAYPGETNIQIRKRLDDSAMDLGAPNWDTSFGYGLVQTPQTKGSTIMPKNIISTFEPLSLYQTMGTTTQVKNKLNSGTYTYTVKNNGWYRVNTPYGLLWIKPSLYYDGIMAKESGRIGTSTNLNIYDTPNLATKPAQVIKPTYLMYDMRWGNWYHVNTYLGYKWIQLPVRINERIRLTTNITLYTTPYVTDKTVVKPVPVTAFEKIENWYHIHTYKGDRWIYVPTPMFESAIVKENIKLSLTKITNIYDLPITGSAPRAQIKPVPIVSYESWNGWYHVRTYLGDKWIKI